MKETHMIPSAEFSFIKLLGLVVGRIAVDNPIGDVSFWN